MHLPDSERSRLLELLQSHNTMALSTVDESGAPWSSILFFSVYPDLTLIYISKRDSAHSRHIEACAKVSVSIYKDEQDRKTARGPHII